MDASEPHMVALPAGWGAELSAFDHLLLLRMLRPDKLIPAVRLGCCCLALLSQQAHIWRSLARARKFVECLALVWVCVVVPAFKLEVLACDGKYADHR